MVVYQTIWSAVISFADITTGINKSIHNTSINETWQKYHLINNNYGYQ